MPTAIPIPVPIAIVIAPGITRPPAAPIAAVTETEAEAKAGTAPAEAQIPARTVIIGIGRIPPIVTQIDAGTVIIRIGIVPVIIGVVIRIIIIAQTIIRMETFQPGGILVIVIIIIIEGIRRSLFRQILFRVIRIPVSLSLRVLRLPLTQFHLVFLFPRRHIAVHIIGRHHESSAAGSGRQSQSQRHQKQQRTLNPLFQNRRQSCLFQISLSCHLFLLFSILLAGIIRKTNRIRKLSHPYAFLAYFCRLVSARIHLQSRSQRYVYCNNHTKAYKNGQRFFHQSRKLFRLV